jgi:LysM repeat protein
MDELRSWLARLIAPLVFILAAVVLVVVVDRALEDSDSSTAPTEPAPAVSESVPTESVETDTTQIEEQFYRIRAGDTLEAISQRFGTTVENLQALNPGIDPLALSPGQRIRVT